MKLFQKLTIQDIMNFENISKATAQREYKELKESLKVRYPKLIHYLQFNNISTNDLENIANITTTIL